MSDYIKREDVLAKSQTMHDFSWATGCGILNEITAVSTREIEAIPAADVRPVVRGHMITREEAERIFETDYSDFPFGQCSVCGHCDWDCTESESFNFCPNCGAEMKCDS